MDNPNTNYELLAKEIYETILCDEGFDTINVQHNVKIAGKSGCEHQIDVYWEFKVGGVHHRVAIECKNYTNDVSIGKVRDFFGVLYDIGNINGIFVTKKGFQSGSVKFADYYGISLMELRFPDEKDWEGLIKDIYVKMNFSSKKITGVNFDYDFDWIKKNTNYNTGDKIDIVVSGDTLIIDMNDNKIASIGEVYNSIPFQGNIEKGLIYEKKFDDAYIYDTNRNKLKIISIIFEYDTEINEYRLVFEGEKIAKAIMKDVKTGVIKFFDKNGGVK